MKLFIYSVISTYLNTSMGVFVGPTKIGTCNTYQTYMWMQLIIIASHIWRLGWLQI